MYYTYQDMIDNVMPERDTPHHVALLPPTQFSVGSEHFRVLFKIVDGTRYIGWRCPALTTINNYNHYVYFCELLTNLSHVAEL